MKKEVLLTVIALTLITSIFILQASVKVRSYETSEIKIPILSVTKLPEKKSLSLGETIRVTIIIRNIGNATAYNITLSDTQPGNWSVVINGRLEMFWPQLPPGAEVIHSYNISFESVSTYVIYLGRAKVIYYDNSSNRYIVYSENPSIYAQIKSGVNVDWDKIWREITLIESLLILTMIIPLITIEYKLYREYRKEETRKRK